MPALGWLRNRRLRDFLGAAIAVLTAYLLYIWRLGTLTGGMSPDEVASRSASAKIHGIIDDPSFAPHRLLQWLAQHLGWHGAFSMRLASVILGMVLVLCFYYVARSWYGRLIAVFSSLIFLTTPVVLLASRSAVPDILYLWPVAIVAVYTWLLRSKSKASLAWLVLCAVAAASIYIPGIAWFVLAGVFYTRKKLLSIIRGFSPLIQALSVLLILAMLVPMAYAIWRHGYSALNIAAIPQHPGHYIDMLKAAGWAALSLVWRSQRHTPLILGRLALLDAMQIILAAIGVFALWSRAKGRLYSIVGIVLVAILLSGLTSQPSYMLGALPPISLLVGIGLRYLYMEWREVFPRNPLPRLLAVFLIGIVVAAHLFFGIRYALVAWPHDMATTTLYVLK